MKRENLILLTDDFPFGYGETYIASEIKYLAGAFSRVVIISARRNPLSATYSLPGNVEVICYRPTKTFTDKITSLRFLFYPLFREEISMIAHRYHSPITWKHLKIMLASLHHADSIRRKIKEIAEKMNAIPSSLLIYSYWMDSKAIGVAWVAKEKKFTAISRAHNWDIYFERQQPAYLPFRKFMADHLSKIYFISAHGRNYFTGLMEKTDLKKCTVSRLGASYIGKNENASSTPFVICSCAWVAPVKRIHLIIEILASLNNIPIRWIHFGDGPQMNEIRKIADSLLKKNAGLSIELMGKTENKTVLDYYQHHHIDLFILTSAFEGIPVSIMEAMAARIPVMATDVGGVSEIVSEKNGFLLLADFSPKDAAEKIKKYMALTEVERQSYRENAFQTWKENYNAEVNYREFADEIASC